MKRQISVLLIILLLSVTVTAHADVPQFSAELFANAKQALVCMASGEYERLVTLLPFSGVSPSANEWQSFVEGNFATLASGVQTEYSVAYWTGNDWRLAVPVSVPANGEVEVLMLMSADGLHFSGYCYSNWAMVQTEYEAASYVTWNQEYLDATPVIAID